MNSVLLRRNSIIITFDNKKIENKFLGMVVYSGNILNSGDDVYPSILYYNSTNLRYCVNSFIESDIVYNKDILMLDMIKKYDMKIAILNYNHKTKWIRVMSRYMVCVRGSYGYSEDNKFYE